MGKSVEGERGVVSAVAHDDTIQAVSPEGGGAPPSTASKRVLPIGSLLGGDRFRVLRRLGEGGMGVVYEAFDAQRDERVALKTLSQSDPRGIYQFKHEFRSLSQLHHPGLVRLHHLFVENDTWFFTMDLIDGQRFDRWARPGGKLDDRRLRDATAQLVRALAAIHEAGKLHRDVKSSNVLVDREGRVVVLDLGLCVESSKGGAGQTISEWLLAGTPEYMAPEQAFGSPATPASDLYGVGVMLFEALMGRLPFRGQLGEMLFAKQHEAELWPQLEESGVPRDLAELCFSLLSRRPEKRPSAEQVLAGAALTAYLPTDPAPAGAARAGSSTQGEGHGAPPLPAGAPGAPQSAALPAGAHAVAEALGESGGARAAPGSAGGLPRSAGVPAGAGGAGAAGAAPRAAGNAHASGERRATPALFGRTAELAALEAAHRDAVRGQAVLLEVTGESGIGKSELCKAFLERARARELAVVLSGRCYEREGVPFKAIDALIDELSRYLRRATREEVAALLPRDVFALTKLFPVLARIDVIAEAPVRELSDPYELQRRAFAAFGELIARLRDRRPLILHIDDAHWTDVDSATFLRHVLVDRGLCALLLVISRRSERSADSLPLNSLIETARANPALSVRSLPVLPLPQAEAERLARQLLTQDTPAAADVAGMSNGPDGPNGPNGPEGRDEDELCRAIAVEARGSPFLVSELARLAMSQHGALGPPSVVGVISARVEGMPASARRLLEVVALVGQPLAARVACEAAGASHTDLDALIEAHLMRDSEAGGHELVECYHDRIRETVANELGPDAARAHYRGLARALARDETADPELVSRCWEGAGDRTEAARAAALAADRASLAMAFDRAAALYERALELSAPERTSSQRPSAPTTARVPEGARAPEGAAPAPEGAAPAPEGAAPERITSTPAELDPSDLDPAELTTRLARALENAGRGAEAAVVYRRAAALVAGEESLELQRRAAEQWLASGHVDEGLELLRTLCNTLGVQFPTSPGSVLLSLAWTTLRLYTRDLSASSSSKGSSATSSVPSSPSSSPGSAPSAGNPAPARTPSVRTAPTRTALRLRTARTLVTSLSSYLPAHAASVAGQYLIAALDSGDVTDRVRAIGFNAYIQSHIDAASPRTATFLRRMDELANESGRSELIAFASLMKGTTAVHGDRHREARQHFAHALAHLRGQAGVAWEIDVANIYDQLSASYAGDYAEIVRSAPALVDEALRRGRVWTGALLSGFSSMPAWVGIDGGQGYRRQLAEVARHWKPRARPQWPDFLLLMGEALLSIYEGHPERGFDLLEVRRAAYDRNMLSRGSGKGRISYAIHHARCAAAALGATPAGRRSERARWTVQLGRAAATIAKKGSPNARGFVELFAAVLELERGASEAALTHLRGALGAFEQAGMRLYAAACQRRLGQLVGGDEGAGWLERGDEYMRSQSVVNIEAETELHCPGVARRA